jgi:hypothetical protein
MELYDCPRPETANIHYHYGEYYHGGGGGGRHRRAGGEHNIIFISKRFLYLCFGFASKSTKQFSYLWIRKVFVSFGSKRFLYHLRVLIQKIFVSFQSIFWIEYDDVTQYPPLELSDVIACISSNQEKGTTGTETAGSTPKYKKTYVDGLND